MGEVWRLTLVVARGSCYSIRRIVLRRFARVLSAEHAPGGHWVSVVRSEFGILDPHDRHSFLGRGGHELESDAQSRPTLAMILAPVPLRPSPCARADISPFKRVPCLVMADSNNPPTRLAEIIDYIENVREELLTIQRSLEKLESVESTASEQRHVLK